MLGCTVKDIWSCIRMVRCLYGCDEWCCTCKDRYDCHNYKDDSELLKKYKAKFGDDKE